MKYLEHYDEEAALGALFAMVCTVDWLTSELASMISPFFGG